MQSDGVHDIDSLMYEHERSSLGLSNLRLNIPKIGSLGARDIMLVSKSIYLRRGSQWYTYFLRNTKIMESHN